MPNSIKTLSKPRKAVVAKVLRSEGFTLAEVGKRLGISEATAMRYADLETPEAMQEFETKFRTLARGMQMEGSAMVLKRLHELLPTERRIEAVVKAGEFLSGGRDKEAPNIQVNVLNKLDSQKKDYNLDE